MCVHGRAGQTQLLFWRRISQSEIRKIAAAEKEAAKARAGKNSFPPTPLPFCSPERSVWCAPARRSLGVGGKRAISPVQKKFGFGQTNAPLRSQITTSYAAQAHSYKIINNVYQLMRRGVPHSFSDVGQKMYYVYILKSDKDSSRYIGVTADLKKRLQEHNSGRSKYSNTKRPYQIIWYSAFSD